MCCCGGSKAILIAATAKETQQQNKQVDEIQVQSQGPHDRTPLDRGFALFHQNCQVCHGPNAGGAFLPNLRQSQMLLSADSWKSVVIDGRNIYDPAKMHELGFCYRAVGRNYTPEPATKVVNNLNGAYVA